MGIENRERISTKVNCRQFVSLFAFCCLAESRTRIEIIASNREQSVATPGNGGMQPEVDCFLAVSGVGADAR